MTFGFFAPMSIYAELAPVYILGNFNLSPSAEGFQIVSPKPATLGSWKDQGIVFYGQSISYTGDVNISTLKDDNFELKINQWSGSVISVIVNNREAGDIAYPPYTLDISKFLKDGSNTITVKVTGTLVNIFGPFHSYVNTPGFVTPWSFLYTRTIPAGDKYFIYDYGMYNPFSVIRKTNLGKPEMVVAR